MEDLPLVASLPKATTRNLSYIVGQHHIGDWGCPKALHMHV